MTGCLINLVKFIWSFILGSLRMILFFGCLLVVFIQLFLLMALVKAEQFANSLPTEGIQSRDYIHVIFMLFIGLLGTYGSFYKHIPSLKGFVILIFVSTVALTFTMIFTMNPDQLEAKNKQIFNRMESFLDKYDWNEESTFSSRVEARVAWDTMQSSLCCGIKSRKDWDKYRPYSVSKNMYPSSCCQPDIFREPFENPKLCSEEDVYSIGCEKRIEQYEAIVVLMIGVYISFQTLLFFIGLVSLAPNSSCISDSSSRNCEESRLANNHVPQAYQKLEHSVYIRQPVTNSSVYPSLLDERHRVYPNLSKSGYLTPPPSYGASS